MAHFVTVKLPGTKTAPFRSASFMRVSLSEVLTGILTVDERATLDGKITTTRYAVQEDPTGGGGERKFRLTKPGGTMWYFVCLSDSHDIYDACECRGFDRQGNCKHLLALRALLREGYLTPKC